MANLLDRNLYRKIKKMDRDTLESLIKEFYDMGAKSVKCADLDMDALRKDIGNIKGIGENRLNEIIAVIENHLKTEDEPVAQ